MRALQVQMPFVIKGGRIKLSKMEENENRAFKISGWLKITEL